MSTPRRTSGFTGEASMRWWMTFMGRRLAQRPSSAAASLPRAPDGARLSGRRRGCRRRPAGWRRRRGRDRRLLGYLDAVLLDGARADDCFLGDEAMAEAVADGFEDAAALGDYLRPDAVAGGVEDVKLSHYVTQSRPSGAYSDKAGDPLRGFHQTGLVTQSRPVGGFFRPGLRHSPQLPWWTCPCDRRSWI